MISLQAAPPVTRWYRSPVTWIIVVIGGFGVAVSFQGYHSGAATFSSAAVLSAAMLALLGLFGWWLLSRIRPLRPAPRARAFACIVWGMTGAIGCAMLANAGLGNLWARTAGIGFASSWGPAVTAPINEETLKMAGLVLLILAVSGWVRGPMEGFVYGSLIGLGFQLVEDWTYTLITIAQSGGIDPVASVMGSLFGRVVLTGLGSHWAMSAVAGAGIGFLVTRRGSDRRLLAGIGLFLLAVLMHSFFDSPVLSGTVGGVAKALVNFAIALSLYFTLRHRLRAAARAELGGDRHASLLTRHRRRRALRRVPRGEPRQAAARDQRERLDQLEQRAYAAA